MKPKKMTKIPLKPKNYQNIPINLKDCRNTSETYKMTKISPKSRNTKILHKPKNDRNILEI